MTEKRKPSTRNRGGPPLKRRPSTPPPAPQPKVEPVAEGLPVKLKDGQHPPTLPVQQDVTLLNADFQSISERYRSFPSQETLSNRWTDGAL